MNTRLTIILSSISVILILSSCVNHKNLTYLQYSGKIDNSTKPMKDTRITLSPNNYKIMPYDNLYIRVITPDPQWSEMFNPVPVGQGGSLTEESAALLGYPVSGDGNIDLPFVGEMSVAGKTLSETKVKLDSIFKNYVTDASITVRLVNNYVSIIGEVRQPGRYPLTKDRVNIFEALSMAGDLSEYSNRHKVQLIRPSPYGPIIKEFSLTDRSILTSDYFYIMPNDIIYAPPIKGKFFGMNSFPYTVLLSSITTFLLIYNLIVPNN